MTNLFKKYGQKKNVKVLFENRMQFKDNNVCPLNGISDEATRSYGATLRSVVEIPEDLELQVIGFHGLANPNVHDLGCKWLNVLSLERKVHEI